MYYSIYVDVFDRSQHEINIISRVIMATVLKNNLNVLRKDVICQLLHQKFSESSMNMKWKLYLEMFSDHKIFEFLVMSVFLGLEPDVKLYGINHYVQNTLFFSYLFNCTHIIITQINKVTVDLLFVYSLCYRFCVSMEIRRWFDYFKELCRHMSTFLSLESKSEVTFDLQGSEKASSATSMTHCLH